jgi:hypothetical protein
MPGLPRVALAVALTLALPSAARSESGGSQAAPSLSAAAGLASPPARTSAPWGPQIPVPDAPSPATLERWVERDARANRLWYGGWLAVSAALTAGQIGIALDASRWEPVLQGAQLRRYRGRMLVGAGTAAIGLAFVAAQAPRTLGGRALLQRRVRDGLWTPEQASCAARHQLLLTGADELGAHSGLSHMGGIGLNLLAGIINATLLRQPDDAWPGVFLGVAISEAQILTRPQAARRAVKQLRLDRLPACEQP